jgi:hypothetical protein
MGYAWVQHMVDNVTDADDAEHKAPSISADDLGTIPSSERDIVEVSVTVDVSDMSDRGTRVLAELADAFEQNFMEIYEKSRDYGMSFLLTGSKLSASDGTPFDTGARSQVFGLLTRSGDKRERLIENVYGDGEASVSDSPSVTAQEAANYYMFMSFVLENPELADSFLDQ